MRASIGIAFAVFWGILTPIQATTRFTVINAAGYDSNLGNVSSPNYGAGANDTKILTGKKLKQSESLTFSLNGSFAAAYRQSGSPSNAKVLQMLPRLNAGAFWLPGILKSLEFKIGLDVNYSHKFNPVFNNKPIDDTTNVINSSEDNGEHTLEQDNHSQDTGSGSHAGDHSTTDPAHPPATESADNDVDDDFDDPDFKGQGAGQSYATLKSFAREGYVNNYGSRLYFFITPFSDWELRFAAMLGHTDVQPQTGLLPASSTAHTYEVGLSHELIRHFELGVMYQIEFRKFTERPAFTNSTDLFFVRTHQIPLELTWYLAKHMRLVAAYAWVYREVPLAPAYNTFLNIAYGEFVYGVSRDLGLSIWGTYAFTKFTEVGADPVNRAVLGAAVIYSFNAFD